MKKFITALLLLSTLIIPNTNVIAISTDPLSTACQGTSASRNSTACQDRASGASKDRIMGKDGILMRIARVLSIVVGVASVIVIIIGGFKYVLSGGDSSGVASAKNTILYALVGLVVALLAQVIVAVFLGRLQ